MKLSPTNTPKSNVMKESMIVAKTFALYLIPDEKKSDLYNIVYTTDTYLFY